MNLFDKPYKPFRQSKSNTLSISSLLDKRTHLKPFSNISEIPIDELNNYNKFRFSADLKEADTIEGASIFMTSPRNSQPLSLKPSADQEEIKNLHEYINLLKRQLSDSKLPGRRFPLESPKARNYESVGDLRMLVIVENENKKLIKKISGAESSIERLYEEIKILNEQLLIYQKRCERYSERSEASPEVSIEDQSQSCVMFLSEKIIRRVENEVDMKYQELANKLESDEKRLEKILSEQFKIKEKYFGNTDEYIQLLKANEILHKQLDSQDPKKDDKINDYEKEIFRLGNIVFKTQEKYDKHRSESQGIITKLLNENSNLKELLVSYDDSLKSTHRLQKATSNKELKQISLQINKKPMYYPEKYNSLHIVKAGETARLKEECKENLMCITEEYEIKLEKIYKELQDTQESYISMENLLLKTQEALNTSEEAYRFLKVNHDQVVGALKNELETVNQECHENQYKINQLLADNKSLQGEITEDSKLELLNKYDRIVEEFGINRRLVEQYQQEIIGYRRMIEDQNLLINSLRADVCPQDSGEEFVQNDYYAESHIPASCSSDEINGKPEKSKIGLNEMLERIDKKNQVIEELRKQVASVTIDYEKLLQELRKCNELYADSKEECIELEKVIEALEFDISLLKSQ